MKTEKSLRLVWQIAAIIVVMAICLRLMGRRWWCECGGWSPWSWDTMTRHNSQHLIDPYFFSHVLHGVIFFWALAWFPPRIFKREMTASTRLRIAVVVEVAWEILENSPWIINRYREATISLDYFGDSIANSITDVLACVLGYMLASQFRFRWSLVLIAATEIVMLFAIRDSLLLNVIMLVSPIEAIKHWQSAL